MSTSNTNLRNMNPVLSSHRCAARGDVGNVNVAKSIRRNNTYNQNGCSTAAILILLGALRRNSVHFEEKTTLEINLAAGKQICHSVPASTAQIGIRIGLAPGVEREILELNQDANRACDNQVLLCTGDEPS